MMRNLICLTLLFAAATMAAADGAPRAAKTKRIWRVSAMVLAAATSADAASSWGKAEANPLLQGPGGRFTARGLALKGGMAGGLLAAQWWLQRRHPGSARASAITNFGLAAVYTGVAVRNWPVERVPAHLRR